jgi:putative membrane-bound dehydrogenase-like protein
MIRLLSIVVVGLLALTTQAADKKKIVFVSHQKSHGAGEHAYAAGCKLMALWLDQAYPGQIETAQSVNWPSDPHFFDGADTVVIFCSGGGGHVVMGHAGELDAVMRRGVGIVCLHYGVEVPIGPSAKGMLDWMGGYFEAKWSVNPTWKPEFKSFPDHPVSRGVQPFSIQDEWYFHMRFKPDMAGVTPILSAVAPASTMSRPDGPHSGNPAVREAVAKGEPQHVAWAYERGEDYGKGRGMGFTGLHYHKNWLNESFRKVVLNGVAWTAHLEVPKDGVSVNPTEAEVNAVLGVAAKPAAQAAAPKGNAKPIFSSKLIDETTPGWSVAIDVDISAAKHLFLVATDGGNGFACDWVDWAEPRLVMADGKEVKLTEIEWKRAQAGFGQARINANVGGQTLRCNGKDIAYGIGTHANSTIEYILPAGAKRFVATGALDEGGTKQGGGTSVLFQVYTEDPGTIRPTDGGNANHDPANAVAAFDTHPDVAVHLFASEPLMLSPSSIDIDARGRVWVCEVVNYRSHKNDRAEGDRILIVEDADHDGKAEKATVFYQGHDCDSAHGICVLGNKALISCGDEVFWLIDDNNDDKADRKEVMFTNIGGAQHDHGIHAFHFGPDGRLYFNFGNAGKQLCDKAGKLITDIHGVKCSNQNNLPYQEGMIFRCELDGSRVELLAWNFRNNWEVAVDSFGTMWQSDNDDDGNKGVRINYVMEFGNYGYKDEKRGRDPAASLASERSRCCAQCSHHWSGLAHRHASL